MPKYRTINNKVTAPDMQRYADKYNVQVSRIIGGYLVQPIKFLIKLPATLVVRGYCTLAGKRCEYEIPQAENPCYECREYKTRF